MMGKAYLFIILTVLVALSSCKSKQAATSEDAPPAEVQTPVTVTGITNEPLTDYAELNATSAFLQNNIIKSNINGYIQAVNTKPGQFAASGQSLFTLKTKEAT